MPLSPFDHPWQSGLFTDEAVTCLFSREADLAAMLDIETALAAAEADEGLMSQTAAKAIAAARSGFRPDFEALRVGFARDGVVVPELVRQLRAEVVDEFRAYVHFGATSQDIVDTSLILRLKQVSDHLDAGLGLLTTEFAALSSAHGARTLMGRTRMQPARPITLADKIATWREPLLRHRARLDEIKPRMFTVEFGGAVGNRNELGVKAQAVVDRLADRLGLQRSAMAHHSQRDGFVEFGNWLALVSGSLGKFGADAALMAMPELGALRLADAGTSSAMPGKSNPVKAEVLVALARFNATLAGGLNQAIVHENERSGAAWTLEWLVLPQMAMTAAASVKLARALIASLDFSGG